MEQNYLTEDVPGSVPLKMWTKGVPVEDEAKRQLANAARLPVVFRHVAAMPDAHVGIGATEGVECRKHNDVIDEIPMAYQDIDAVMAAQADLVDIVHTLKQVVCVKG